MTAMFLFIILGATHGKEPVGFAPLAIGLALTALRTHTAGVPSVTVLYVLGPSKHGCELG